MWLKLWHAFHVGEACVPLLPLTLAVMCCMMETMHRSDCDSSLLVVVSSVDRWFDALCWLPSLFVFVTFISVVGMTLSAGYLFRTKLSAGYKSVFGRLVGFFIGPPTLSSLAEWLHYAGSLVLAALCWMTVITMLPATCFCGLLEWASVGEQLLARPRWVPRPRCKAVQRRESAHRVWKTWGKHLKSLRSTCRAYRMYRTCVYVLRPRVLNVWFFLRCHSLSADTCIAVFCWSLRLAAKS